MHSTYDLHLIGCIADEMKLKLITHQHDMLVVSSRGLTKQTMLWNPLLSLKDSLQVASYFGMVIDFDYNGKIAVGNAEHSFVTKTNRWFSDTEDPSEILRILIVELALTTLGEI